MTYFCLYSNCIATKGYKRSLLSDLSNNKLKFIPNFMFDILEEVRYTDIALIQESNSEIFEIIFSFLENLKSEGWGAFGSLPNEFPLLSVNYENNIVITNSIIDVNTECFHLHYYAKFIEQLSNLKCEAVQIRVSGEVNLEFINNFLLLFSNTKFDYVEILIQKIKKISYLDFKRIFENNVFIRNISIYNSIESKTNLYKKYNQFLYKFSNDINFVEHCGKININSFSSNIKFYVENYNHNSCLNKKISINSVGEIKICPSHNIVLGHIKDDLLSNILIKSKNIINSLNIPKKYIKICENCEFRNICSDCRVYLQNPDDLYSKPLKCSYDPSTMLWHY